MILIGNGFDEDGYGYVYVNTVPFIINLLESIIPNN